MLEIKNLSVKIKKKNILRELSFVIKQQSVTAILGKNGSGKSTLISCINHTKNYSGSIFWGDKELKTFSIKERAQKIAVLAQNLSNPHIKVEELVAMGRNPYLEIGQRLKETDLKKVDQALEVMGIAKLRDSYLDEISGGERQKAYLSMIVAQDTPMLVLDEPTTYLDVEFRTDFMKCLKKLKEHYGKTILVVMHDINAAMEYADQVLVLDQGEIIFAGSKDDCIRQEVIERNFNGKKFQVDERIIYLT